VLPHSIRARVAVEAGGPHGWHRWVGEHGRIVALDRFGASAPGATVMAELGFTAGRVAQEGRLAVRDIGPNKRSPSRV
jgi:transketolase